MLRVAFLVLLCDLVAVPHDRYNFCKNVAKRPEEAFHAYQKVRGPTYRRAVSCRAPLVLSCRCRPRALSPQSPQYTGLAATQLPRLPRPICVTHRKLNGRSTSPSHGKQSIYCDRTGGSTSPSQRNFPPAINILLPDWQEHFPQRPDTPQAAEAFLSRHMQLLTADEERAEQAATGYQGRGHRHIVVDGGWLRG